MTHEDHAPDERRSLGAPIKGKPWARSVDTAEVHLECDWPPECPARIFRGAVIAQVDEILSEIGGASVRWHNHDDNDDGAHRMPEVLYRVRDGRPSVYLLGPKAHANGALLAGHLSSLRLPKGQVLDVRGAGLQRDTTEVQVLGKTWRTYETASPVFPPEVAYRRRPRGPGNHDTRNAWASLLLTTSITAWMEATGWEYGQHPVCVHLLRCRDRRVTWERPGRDIDMRWWGFTATFVANVHLPDGIGLGQHRSEGWGEIRHA